MQYRLISADSHVVEPPDLWRSRVPQRFRARAPHQVRMEKGDAWVIEGLAQPFPFGLVQCGGLPPEQYRLWVRWEEVRPDASQPGPRLAALDEAGCDAEVMYPSPRIQNAIAENESDADLQIACVRAYNDWLSEFCSVAPQRFAGVALLPSVGVAAALAELERALALPGMRSVLMSRYPHGGTSFSDEDDPFWARCAERGVPVNVHVGLSGSPSGTPALGHTFSNAFTGAFRFYDSPVRLAELVYRRVFDRFPGLQIVFAEVDVRLAAVPQGAAR